MVISHAMISALVTWVLLFECLAYSKTGIVLATQKTVPAAISKKAERTNEILVTAVPASTTTLSVSVVAANTPSYIEYKAFPDGKQETPCTPKKLPLYVCVINQLRAGERCTGEVKACKIGADPSECQTVGPFAGWAKPNAPQSVVASIESTSSIRVAATAPSDPNRIGKYIAFVISDPAKSCTSRQMDKPACVIRGLESAVEYVATVKSCIDGADEDYCNEGESSSAWTLPSAPKGVDASALSTTSLEVTVLPPDNPNGITRYDVTLKGTIPEVTNQIPAKSSPLSTEFTNLSPGSEYTVEAKSYIEGARLSSTSTTSIKVWTKPNEPTSVEVVGETTASLTVTFEAPAGSKNIGRYDVYLVGDDTGPKCSRIPEDELKCLLPGLVAGTKYGVKVKSCITNCNPAVCSDGVIKSGYTKPNVPVDVTVKNVNPRSVIAVWSEPVGNTENIKLYQALARETSGELAPFKEHLCHIEAPFKALECSIGDLSPSTHYSIFVRACISPNLCGAETGAVKVFTCQDSPNYVLIISLLVVIFVIIIIVIILLFVCCRRRKSSHYVEEYDKNDFLSDLRTIVDVKQN